MIKKTIKAYAYSSSTDIIQGTDHFTEALDARTGLERDARKAFLDLVFLVLMLLLIVNTILKLRIQ